MLGRWVILSSAAKKNLGKSLNLYTLQWTTAFDRKEGLLCKALDSLKPVVFSRLRALSYYRASRRGSGQRGSIITFFYRTEGRASFQPVFAGEAGATGVNHHFFTKMSVGQAFSQSSLERPGRRGLIIIFLPRCQ